jgi:hypothetical protein
MSSRASKKSRLFSSALISPRTGGQEITMPASSQKVSQYFRTPENTKIACGGKPRAHAQTYVFLKAFAWRGRD